ncbi:transmembrane protein, putative (macronuclear) [Tetrahymena thermophila SB210]|uniref:Transmembrane protein, putative n=1 Tax=Tetrahymena thermophila (strain SB210) TaxID=312017 RepID=I7MI69_TETTS|nr:transmembrane protein, putative [Tetrahymena thermophila SB210]EAR90938.3 transmembrane protein, putative [Tetrahymena thermophila SB210]|eukprot:XP_001011183.3 transmembrane protein, putative [Tetrahymena thermophila SB210]
MDQKDSEVIKKILDYWFIPADWDRHSRTSPEASKRHFFGGQEVDQYIINNFSHLFDQIKNKQLEHWKKDHFGRLAYIITCDQFSRNAFRESAKQYDFDQYALDLSDEITANQEMYNAYKFYERQFIILPYMHSENLQHHHKCLELSEQVSLEAEKQNLPDVAKAFKQMVQFGKSHMEAILKFGRYPSRNKVLGRESTQEEIDYMNNGGKW